MSPLCPTTDDLSCRFFSQIVLSNRTISNRFPAAALLWAKVPREVATPLAAATRASRLPSAFFARTEVDNVRLDILLLAALWDMDVFNNQQLSPPLPFLSPVPPAADYSNPELDILLQAPVSLPPLPRTSARALWMSPPGNK